jgi:hypothetical protein
MSSRITFHPFNGAYPQLDKHFAVAGLDPAVDKWHKVSL